MVKDKTMSYEKNRAIIAQIKSIPEIKSRIAECAEILRTIEPSVTSQVRLAPVSQKGLNGAEYGTVNLIDRMSQIQEVIEYQTRLLADINTRLSRLDSIERTIIESLYISNQDIGSIARDLYRSVVNCYTIKDEALSKLGAANSH